MKKSVLLLFISVISVAVSLTSCNTDELSSDEPLESSVPSELVATLNPEAMTRTAYDATGKFAWLETDKVSLLLSDNLSTYSKLGSQLYEVKSLENENRTAVFKAVGSDDELNAYSNGTWNSADMAIYPSSLAVNDDNNNYGVPYIELPQVISGIASEIVLTGVPTYNNSNYKFSTAMSVISFTLENIPASAAQLRLYTVKETYPIDGYFSLIKGGDGKIAIGASNKLGNAHDYIYVDLSSEGAIDSRSFYFNIPIANYPAGTLYLLLCDANGGQIMKRTVNVALNLARNEALVVPSLAYSSTVAFSGGSDLDPQVAWTIDCKQIRFCVSTSETNNLAAYNVSDVRTGTNTTGSFSGTQALTALATGPSVSGKYYLHYILQSDNGGVPATLDAANVVSYGTLPFFFSSEDYDWAGKYVFTWIDCHNEGKSSNPSDRKLCSPGFQSTDSFEASMTLDATDDFTKGTVRLVNLYGKDATNPLYGYYDGTNNKLVFPEVQDEDKYFFTKYYKLKDSYFYVSGCTNVTYQYPSYNLSSDISGDVEFTIGTTTVNKQSIRSLTNSKYLMMKYTTTFPVTEWTPYMYGKGFVMHKGNTPYGGEDPNAGSWM